MRYNLVIHVPPSPSDAGLFNSKIAVRHSAQSRLPTSRHHRLRKSSVSTSSGSLAGTEKPAQLNASLPQPKPRRPQSSLAITTTTKPQPIPLPLPLPQLRPWESYLNRQCLSEEPGALWRAALCATFLDCLTSDDTAVTAAAAESAARIEQIYDDLYLPLDPLLQFTEDRIIAGYLLQIWTMFIELAKRIDHTDEVMDRLVAMLKELIHLPPRDFRTWEGNDCPWMDLPTLDDALASAWDDLYDQENEITDPERQWRNYFSFLGRLVVAEVTTDWWEIPAMVLQEVLSEEANPNPMTQIKTQALAEYMNQAGDLFFEWCVESGALNVSQDDLSLISPMLEDTVRNWDDRRNFSNAKDEPWSAKGAGDGLPSSMWTMLSKMMKLSGDGTSVRGH